MSDYHVMAFGSQGVFLALHVRIPAANNTNGVSFRQCIVDDPNVDKTSKVPGLSTSHAAEVADLASGALYEVVENVPLHPDLPDTGNQGKNKLAILDAYYAQRATEIIAALQSRYQYWGFARDVT